MSNNTRLRYLRTSLVLFGLFCIFGIYTMMNIWPGAWTWEPRQTEYEQMIVGIYATMGVFMLLAARNPMSHKIFVWFVVWSSIVHGALMTAQAISDVGERMNLVGDVAALFLMGGVLAWLMLKGEGNS